MITVKEEQKQEPRKSVLCLCRRTLEYSESDVKVKDGPVVWDPTYIHYIECPICFREVEVR